MMNKLGDELCSANSNNRRPDIDVLRAVAVISVLLFHLDISWLPGGFLGVDVFFVISGFLISGNIVKLQVADQFTFSKFYARRMRRLLPAFSQYCWSPE